MYAANKQLNHVVKSRWQENMEPRLTVYQEMSLHLKKIIMHSKIHLFRQSMYNRRHCYPYESINSAQQKPEKCNSIRCSLAPPSHSGSLRTNVSFSVHQIIKTPQEFVHYSSWLEKAFWWGKHTATFQKTFSSIELPSPITQKSWWF